MVWSLLPLIASVATAEETTRDQAVAHYNIGQRAYESGRYREAAGEFAAAYALQARPALLFNEAQSWRRDFESSGERISARRAVDLYRRYLSAPKIDDNDRREAADRLAALSTLIVDQTPPPTVIADAKPRRTGLWIGLGVGAGVVVAVAAASGVGVMRTS